MYTAACGIARRSYFTGRATYLVKTSLTSFPTFLAPLAVASPGSSALSPTTAAVFFVPFTVASPISSALSPVAFAAFLVTFAVSFVPFLVSFQAASPTSSVLSAAPWRPFSFPWRPLGLRLQSCRPLFFVPFLVSFQAASAPSSVLSAAFLVASAVALAPFRFFGGRLGYVFGLVARFLAAFLVLSATSSPNAGKISNPASTKLEYNNSIICVSSSIKDYRNEPEVSIPSETQTRVLFPPIRVL